MESKAKSVARRFLDLFLKWISILFMLLFSQMAIERILPFFKEGSLTGALHGTALFFMISIILSFLTLSLPTVQRIIDVMFGEDEI